MADRRRGDAPVSPDRIADRRRELKASSGFEAGPQTADIVRNAARTAHVVGGVLQGISATSPLSRVGTWLSVLGRRLVGLVEAAIPRTLAHHVFRHFLGVAYVFGVFVVVVGTVFDFARPWRTAAWKLLGVLIALDVLVLIVSALIRSWRGTTRAVGRVVLLLVAIAVVGALALGFRAAPGFVADVGEGLMGRRNVVLVVTRDQRAFVGVLRSPRDASLLEVCTTGPDRRPGRLLSIPRENVSSIEPPPSGAEQRSRVPSSCR